MTPGSRAAGDTGPTRGAELCSQCEIVVCFSVSFERVLFTWITATARLSLFHTPVETFTPPQVMKSGRLICRSTILYDCALLSILCAGRSALLGLFVLYLAVIGRHLELVAVLLDSLICVHPHVVLFALLQTFDQLLAGLHSRLAEFY